MLKNKNEEIENEEINEEEVIEEPIEEPIKVDSEKEKLLEVYQIMQNYKINSISDIENIIAKME